MIEEGKPIGSIQWKIEAEKCKKYAIKNKRLFRDQNGLKGKFGNIVSIKMRTGDPSFSDTVRYAKDFARKIICKVNLHQRKTKATRTLIGRWLIR